MCVKSLKTRNIGGPKDIREDSDETEDSNDKKISKEGSLRSNPNKETVS